MDWRTLRAGAAREARESCEQDTVRLFAAVKTLCSWGSGSVRIGTPKSVDMEAQDLFCRAYGLWSDLFLTQYACRPPHRRLQRQVALKICADRSVKLHMALSIGLRFISCKLYTERLPLQDQLPHVASRLLSKSVQTGL